jgi:hypothetical protein
MTAIPSARRSALPRDAVETTVRRLSASLAAGAVLGALVGGVGGRLAMLLLARRNPAVTGVVSDDGFEIGRFTPTGSLNLLLAGAFLGTLGGVIYLGLRSLMIGPRWFQVLSVSVGPAVVVGSMLVHPEGVDFVLLGPLPLTVALFLLIPGLFAAAMTLLGERWLAPGSWFLTAHSALTLVPLVLALPLLPLVLPMAALWALGTVLRRTSRGAAVLSSPVLPWAARALLAAVFVGALAGLVSDLRVLS